MLLTNLILRCLRATAYHTSTSRSRALLSKNALPGPTTGIGPPSAAGPQSPAAAPRKMSAMESGACSQQRGISESELNRLFHNVQRWFLPRHQNRNLRGSREAARQLPAERTWKDPLPDCINPHVVLPAFELLSGSSGEALYSKFQQALHVLGAGSICGPVFTNTDTHTKADRQTTLLPDSQHGHSNRKADINVLNNPALQETSLYKERKMSKLPKNRLLRSLCTSTKA